MFDSLFLYCYTGTMSISAFAFDGFGNGLPSLGGAFNERAYEQAIDPIQVRSGSDAGNDEAERCNLNPGARSLKERVLTLIDNNKPGIALDILQAKMAFAPEDVEAIADDVLYELKESGFERDAQEFKIILASADLEAPKPKASAEQTLSALSFG